ncbi:GGDEF domain-containing protein [Vibrio fluminensis]|uniref:GGDEF domain-containing protein n=1 Tax=Vibrio fluminensis TaxID=2783614 RepID=UPI0018872992|nr:GGDEF domain-containing protein [Vibrio fluminensis]
MANDKNTSKKNILKRSKVLLIVLSIVLVVANCFVLLETRALSRSFSEQQNQATWSLFQLSKEFSSLVTIAPVYAASDQYRIEAELAYELTWSRFDLLLHAKESESFMEIEGTRQFFSQLFDRYKKLESLAINIDTPVQAETFVQQLNSIYRELLDYLNQNFQIKNPFFQKQTERARALEHLQISLMLLLFSCFMLVGYILNLESKSNRQLAMTDALTNIPNRLAMAQVIQDHIDQQLPFTLCILDLNGFKQINDLFGHQAGDKALQILAKRFMNTDNRLQFSCYRIGGDEFALILRQKSSAKMEHALNCALDCFSEEFEVKPDTLYPLSASVGLASYPNQGKDFSSLISIADRNMYQMKFATRSRAKQT